MKSVLLAGLNLLLSTNAIAQVPVTATPRWTVTDETSPLTGARTLTGSISSQNQIANTLGYPAHAVLAIRCGEGGLAVYVNWTEVVGYHGRNFVGSPKTFATWRIDGSKVESGLWDISSTGTAAGEFGHKNALKLLRSLAQARTLVVRLSGRHTQDAEFDMTGVDIPADWNRWSRQVGIHRLHLGNRAIDHFQRTERHLQAGRHPPTDLQRNPKTPWRIASRSAGRTRPGLVRLPAPETLRRWLVCF